ncbi:MAG TPA: GNAT family N-acetyltransferase [Bdellovibrionota bacterium]|jgi:predicted GNAT family N-acyltransferase|nr:GNAT family N-acetyltransferase [Bdellovibrionota bacterium]
MSESQITVARSEAEREACLRIRREVFVDEQQVPEALEIDEYEDASTHFLLCVEGEPVATGRLRPKGPFIKFERIATRHAFRGQGWGGRLMEFMQEHAERHHSELTPAMHAQTSAITFYEKLGWVAEGKIFFEAGIPHRLLTRKL